MKMRVKAKQVKNKDEVTVITDNIKVISNMESIIQNAVNIMYDKAKEINEILENNKNIQIESIMDEELINHVQILKDVVECKNTHFGLLSTEESMNTIKWFIERAEAIMYDQSKETIMGVKNVIDKVTQDAIDEDNEANDVLKKSLSKSSQKRIAKTILGDKSKEMSDDEIAEASLKRSMKKFNK